MPMIKSYTDILIALSRFSRKHPLFHQFLHRCSVAIVDLQKFIPDELYAKQMYKRYTGLTLNLKEPHLFNEKLWWIKLNVRNPLMTRCTDKYLVREYVVECGYPDILNKLYGVYDKAEQVPLDSFSKEVFIKCNHGSGTNCIYRPQSNFDRRRFISDFNFDLKQNHFWNSREWNYKNIVPRIMCERVLRDKNGKLPRDYKFMCFHGKPKLLFLENEVCDENGRRNTSGTRFINVYDMDFKLTPITSGCLSKANALIERPTNFEYMKEIASKLSEPFPHCRVDLYDLEGKVYFGEITFFHGGGCVDIKPYEMQLQMGNWIDLAAIPSKYIKKTSN